jgi:hypothetical protein
VWLDCWHGRGDREILENSIRPGPDLSLVPRSYECCVCSCFIGTL